MNDFTSTHPLIAFLTDKMSMTDVYQPAVIKELLVHGGTRSKSDLAQTLARYDVSIQGYYEKVVMRWPTMAEVILTLARQYGADEEAFLYIVQKKRQEKGGFSEGFIFTGDRG